jgi:hypothetical protein
MPPRVDRKKCHPTTGELAVPPFADSGHDLVAAPVQVDTLYVKRRPSGGDGTQDELRAVTSLDSDLSVLASLIEEGRQTLTSLRIRIDFHLDPNHLDTHILGDADESAIQSDQRRAVLHAAGDHVGIIGINVELRGNFESGDERDFKELNRDLSIGSKKKRDLLGGESTPAKLGRKRVTYFPMKRWRGDEFDTLSDVNQGSLFGLPGNHRDDHGGIGNDAHSDSLYNCTRI